MHTPTEAFKELISCICEYFEAKDIPVYSEPTEALYALCSLEQKKTKKALMKSLTMKYPQLSYCYHKEVRNKSKYYIKLFEAVAIALLTNKGNSNYKSKAHALFLFSTVFAYQASFPPLCDLRISIHWKKLF